MLRELRRDTLGTTTEWAEVPDALSGRFSDMPQGLYVFVFANDSDADVLDSNKKPKVVVRSRGASIKPGKFEQGLAARLQNYNAHLHRVSPGGAQWVLGECFRVGFLVDLSEAVGAVQKPARVFERYWIEAVGAFLFEHNLLAERQLDRAEWRYLRADRWTPAIEERLRKYMGVVSERIFEMARVGALPSPSMA